MRYALTTEFTIFSHNNRLLKRFSRLSIVELLTLRADCSRFALKPARFSRLLPQPFCGMWDQNTSFVILQCGIPEPRTLEPPWVRAESCSYFPFEYNM
jgi:hypothetical protein